MVNEYPNQPSADLAPLLRAAAAGDQAAWREIVSLYSRRVFALARSRCRNSDVAEEITQSVFATIAMKLGAGEYAERGRFESWIFRVAANRIRDHIRRVKRRPEAAGSDQLDAHPAPPTPPESPELTRLRLAMDSLTDADREIVELRHHGGLSFKQIADSLNEPLGTLLARHHRALRKLRDMLEGTPAAAETDAGPRPRAGFTGPHAGLAGKVSS